MKVRCANDHNIEWEGRPQRLQMTWEAGRSVQEYNVIQIDANVMRDQLLAHRRSAYIYFHPLQSNPSTFDHLCLYNVHTKAFKHCDYKFKILTLRIYFQKVPLQDIQSCKMSRIYPCKNIDRLGLKSGRTHNLARSSMF